MPAGMNEDGEIKDVLAYDAWLSDEQTQREMQRREEVNINHSHHIAVAEGNIADP